MGQKDLLVRPGRPFECPILSGASIGGGQRVNNKKVEIVRFVTSESALASC